jgi:hypothetical protein
MAKKRDTIAFLFADTNTNVYTNQEVPSGKRLHNYGKSPFSWEIPL